ncbi:hypothetical protein ADH76_04475 [Enterocloster clostridioformis]|nr:hypothetical protein A4V08_00125 [Lachnoclostridium sp. YL32]NDO28191.1 hypothetical protein [Enterocloster clostridioformis]OXE70640.1 hypothetical protein ADH76_04475 [Enterocloster clostridioformis]QQR00789.1 hypothetical protein I5Q83_34505 [Enterocloster clostridioformis]
MKRKILLLLVAVTIVCSFPIVTFAEDIEEQKTDICLYDTEDFEMMIQQIQKIKTMNIGASDDVLLQKINDSLMTLSRTETRGIVDIWNSLTETEKKLCIRYPIEALKVNEAKNIATSKTVEKFGYNGLGDRSDAFRHGMWNAEMTILIGEKKAELFATAHEEKDVTGVETDGFSKVEHKRMDLHNNKIGRNVGQKHIDWNESQMADLMYSEVNNENTEFVWLHE